jgi:hypothetical protein
MDFGEYSATSRGAPRYAGYSHNWARSGATSSTLQSEGQHSGMAELIVNGEVSLVFLGIGANDFAPFEFGTVQLQEFGSFAVNLTNEYGPIYIGRRTDQQVADRVNNLVNNFTTVLDTVSSAGASVVIGTAIDFGSLPKARDAYPDATRRQRITDALLAANTQITDIALSRGMPVVDLAALVNLYYSSTPVLVGGIDTKSPGRFFLGDGMHPGTLIQGLVANAFIAAANDAFDTDFTPLSAAEILMNAGISPPNPLGDTFDVTTLVRLPPAMMLPGDYNASGAVEQGDLDLVLLNWGNQLTDPAGAGWITHFPSGLVDQTELDTVLLNWGSSVAVGTAAVPEPSSLALLAVLLVLGSLCRRATTTKTASSMPPTM